MKKKIDGFTLWVFVLVALTMLLLCAGLLAQETCEFSIMNGPLDKCDRIYIYFYDYKESTFGIQSEPKIIKKLLWKKPEPSWIQKWFDDYIELESWQYNKGRPYH